ncbi:conserved hypothetical protein [Trichinella spiralis]|uniref:hypothetical protein n=1 Tax=Trichinella spiralis TaxID=6334 RepID=UPI0001EFBFA6|nr:conserved hypothetical protein [Trichinella spiralis]
MKNSPKLTYKYKLFTLITSGGNLSPRLQNYKIVKTGNGNFSADRQRGHKQRETCKILPATLTRQLLETTICQRVSEHTDDTTTNQLALTKEAEQQQQQEESSP